MSNGLFKPATVSQAYLKMGITGMAAAGKTYTAMMAAIGHVKATENKKPIYFFDTESGADWFVGLMKKEKLAFEVARSRAFKDMYDAVAIAEKEASFLIVDSVTHPWRELVEARREDKRKKKGKPEGYHIQLTINDWGILKPLWFKFTERMVAASVNMIICGRAGYEYDHVEEDGRKELRKTGVKMAGEKETGFEPSLSLFMEQATDPETLITTRTMTVTKDRSQTIDGHRFTFTAKDAKKMLADNKIYKAILPHVSYLGKPSDHAPLETGRNSGELFSHSDGDPEAQKYMKEKERLLAEIGGQMGKRLNTRQADDKRFSFWLIEAIFGCTSWESLKAKKVDELKFGHQVLKEFFSLYDTGSEPERVQLRLDAAAYVQDCKDAVTSRPKGERPTDPEPTPQADADGDENDLPF